MCKTHWEGRERGGGGQHIPNITSLVAIEPVLSGTKVYQCGQQSVTYKTRPSPSSISCKCVHCITSWLNLLLPALLQFVFSAMLNLAVYFNTACWYYKLLDLFINVFLGKKGPPEYKCNKKLRHIYRILCPIVRAQLISNPLKKGQKLQKCVDKNVKKVEFFRFHYCSLQFLALNLCLSASLQFF